MKLHFSKNHLFYGIFLSISSLIFLLYIIGAANYITNHDENTCDMTYMFEYPQYVRIGLSSKNDDVSEDYLFPRFQLFAYGEGFVTERLRRMHFSGIPVLFIPGNAGSHEQARSLASVSLRKSLKGRTPFHFDYFSISFGKDYSALYGGVLQEETNFVAKCIRRILSLYQGRVENIILIGHSMGGIIAKGSLLLVPEINSNVASILITLAAPHKPSLYPDYTFLNYYKKLKSSMSELQRNGTTVISIGGGPRDVLVPSYQTLDEYADLNALTTNIPGVWRSTDHLCILWCKQLILNIVRSLFDCVDTTQRPAAIFKNHDYRMKAFNWHFHHHYSFEKHLPRIRFEEKVNFPIKDSEWIEDIRRQYVWNSKNYFSDKSKRATTIYLMIRLSDYVDALTINAKHLKTKDWIFACSASNVHGQSRVCPWGWNLSNYTRIIPGLTRKPWKYSVDLNLNEFRALGVSHVVVKVLTKTSHSFENDRDEVNDDDDDDDDQIVQVDAYLRASRYKRVGNSKPWTSELGNLRYYVKLDGVTDAVALDFKNPNCTENTHSHYPLIELFEPWAPGSNQFHFFVENESPKVIKLQMLHSQQLQAMKSQSAELRLFLDPECSYDIYVQRADLIERISCSIRDRWPFIYPITIGLLLLSIGQRIDSQNTDNTSITTIIIITTILCVSLNLIIECCVCMAVLHLMAIGVCCSVVFFGSVAHNIAVRFLARAITFSTTWSDWLLGGLINQLPILAAGILLSIIPATCGALAMLLSIFFHFLRLTRMYEDYLEEMLFASLRYFNLWKKREKNDDESSELTRRNIFNQVLLFLFWCFAALPAIPSALVWAKNFSFSTRLVTEDQVFLYSWIVMVACGTSGLVRIPLKSSDGYRTKFLAALLRCLGWISLVMPALSNVAHYYWTFPPCLAVVVVLISINSLH